jgi:hypothetical protein
MELVSKQKLKADKIYQIIKLSLTFYCLSHLGIDVMQYEKVDCIIKSKI